MSRKTICTTLFSVLLAVAAIVSACGGEAVSQTVQLTVDTTGQEISSTTVESAVPLSEDGWLLGIALPSTVPQVTAKLGEPSSFDLPDLERDPSPWGQWFRWKVADNDFTYSVMTNDYSDQTPGYDADVHAAVLRRDADVVSPALFDGVRLGLTTRVEVEAGFGAAVQPSDLAERWQFDDTGTFTDCLVREEDGIFTFYLFDPNEVLVGIAQAINDLGTID